MNQVFAEAGRKLVILIAQTVMVAAALFLALLLHYEGEFPPAIAGSLVGLLLPLVAIKLGSFAAARLFSGWWRYVSLPDLVALLKGNVLGSLLFAAYVAFASPLTLSWPILVLDGLLCFLLMSGSRVAVRLGREYLCLFTKSCGCEEKRVLIVGSGAIGQSVVREVRQNPKLRWKIVGYVDQEHERLKQTFQGVEVLADIDGLDRLLRKIHVDQVILANPTMTGPELRKVVGLCGQHDVKSLILPNVGELLDEKISVQHLRDVKLDDLLGRPPVRLEVDEIRRYLTGKRILVTGAAGSIGREVCRQVAEFGAAEVVLFDNAETPLFHVERELRSAFPEVRFIPRLSDVRNVSHIDFVFRNFAPEVVFHAAAYKHVPMSEDNPVATVENNVLGTRHLADTACRHGVEHFVMISTDKAVNPTNIMGASKRAAEIYVQALAQHTRTSIVTVRFGNVLGSNGSVVPIFQEQIRGGGPVTVTDPQATRFFMTIPEAVQLVLQAGSMGQGGEIFILNMGEQMSIVHLAEELIRLSGKAPYRDIDIVFTGLRPGEKLHEELLLDTEDVMPTSHEKICVAQACHHDIVTLNRQIDNLAASCRRLDREGVLFDIKRIVPEYRAERRRTVRTTARIPAMPPVPEPVVFGAAETA